MMTLLERITGLEAVHDVLLLSRQGELLYRSRREEEIKVLAMLHLWRKLLRQLEGLQSAQFMYQQGLCSICHTDVGYIVVLLGHSARLSAVKLLCTTIAIEMAASSGRVKALLQLLGLGDVGCMATIIERLSLEPPDEYAKALLPLLQPLPPLSSTDRKRLLHAVRLMAEQCANKQNAEVLHRLIRQHQPATTPQHQRTDGAALQNRGSMAHRNMPSAAATAQEECSRSDKKEAAALLKQIEEAARQGVFDQADRLRDRLINLDGMMLTEIIKAAEIIEAAKTAAISPEHLRTWQALTEILSPEEFAALYHGLTPRSYARGEDVVRQGDYLSQLIFINSGQIEILAETAQGSYLLKTAGPGEVLGGDTFFEASVWTVTGRSLGAEVLMLSRKTLEQLAESHPALESKMMDFCMRPISVETLFRNSGRSRRHFSRRALTGRTAVQLLDGSGRDTRITFKGELADVSCGGVSFFARVSRRKSANRLCGGKIRIDIPSSNSRPGIVRTGKIVAIRGHHLVSNEYTVHVRFDAALTVQEMQQVAVGCC